MNQAPTSRSMWLRRTASSHCRAAKQRELRLGVAVYRVTFGNFSAAAMAAAGEGSATTGRLPGLHASFKGAGGPAGIAASLTSAVRAATVSLAQSDEGVSCAGSR